MSSLCISLPTLLVCILLNNLSIKGKKNVKYKFSERRIIYNDRQAAKIIIKII